MCDSITSILDWISKFNIGEPEHMSLIKRIFTGWMSHFYVLYIDKQNSCKTISVPFGWNWCVIWVEHQQWMNDCHTRWKFVFSCDPLNEIIPLNEENIFFLEVTFHLKKYLFGFLFFHHSFRWIFFACIQMLTFIVWIAYISIDTWTYILVLLLGTWYLWMNNKLLY